MQDNYDNHPLDLSYLSEMAGHDPIFMIEIFDTFINQTPFYIAELEDALLNKNLDKVANCAHKIKPTLSYVGRSDVKDFIQEIEYNAKNGKSIEEIESQVEMLKEKLQKVYLQLEQAKIDFRPKS